MDGSCLVSSEAVFLFLTAIQLEADIEDMVLIEGAK
jgi:hypothetical protein